MQTRREFTDRRRSLKSRVSGREIAAIATGVCAILGYLNQLMQCAAEHEQFQSAVQALAELAWHQP